MKKNHFVAATLFCSNLALAGNPAWADKAITAEKTPPIPILYTGSAIKIDGKLDDAAWKTAQAHEFNFYYRATTDSDRQKTKFRMLWDDQALYVAFEVQDNYITAREKTRDEAPYLDDCAEIFLIPEDTDLPLHFGFEVNLYKVANDFIYLNNFYKNEKVVVTGYDPEYEVGVTINGSLNDNQDLDRGWVMEMAIPLKVLSSRGEFSSVSEGVIWKALAVRQDRNDLEGDRRTTSTWFANSEENFDVHAPKHFGRIQFVKSGK